MAFLPSGGIIDRLGDSREKNREKAREALVLLGGFAFRCGGTSTMMNRSRDGKGPETPVQYFEKHLRELGLASKVWRVREQVRLHAMFKVRISDRGPTLRRVSLSLLRHDVVECRLF